MHPLRGLYVFLALVIVLTILAFVVTKRLALAEEDSPASILSSPSVTVIHPYPNTDYVYDQNGNSASMAMGSRQCGQRHSYANWLIEGHATAGLSG